MSQLHSKFFNRRGDESRGCKKFGVVIPLNNLGRDRSGLQSQAFTEILFNKGGMWAKVPTAPEIFQHGRSLSPSPFRIRFRFISSYQRAIFRPKVIGSA